MEVHGSYVFGTHLKLECQRYCLNKKQIKLDIHRSMAKKQQIQQSNIKKQQQSSRLRAHISRQNKRLSTIENNNISNIISSSLASDAKPNEVKVFKGSEVNLRSLLGAFMIGTGATDIARFMTMVGVGGGSAFERRFYSEQAEKHVKFY